MSACRFVEPLDARFCFINEKKYNLCIFGEEDSLTITVSVPLSVLKNMIQMKLQVNGQKILTDNGTSTRETSSSSVVVVLVVVVVIVIVIVVIVIVVVVCFRCSYIVDGRNNARTDEPSSRF